MCNYLFVFMCIYSTGVIIYAYFLKKCVKLWEYIFTVCLKCTKRLIKYLSS